MKIAVEGCAHGELDNIYNTIKYLEEKQGFKVDLLICCGDFQSSRNEEDLRCMAVPPKYYKMCSFYKYYSGEKTAPILTIFIGGNHEASNYLQELPYGGWVAPNIFYMGYAGVINIAGIRIGGLSGIYKGRDYLKGHFEYAPYNDNSKRSVYHIRNLEVFRLKQISEPLDIFISHDWPSGVWDYGNKEQLIRFKPFFEEDIKNETLGSKPTGDLMNHLKPHYWFSAHLHCKFSALIPHSCGKITKFLALDKCLPKRRFLQLLDIPHNTNLNVEISYDLEWLTILRLTNHLLSVKSYTVYMPGPNGTESSPTAEEKSVSLEKMGSSLIIPNNFVKTAPAHISRNNVSKTAIRQPNAVLNPQTELFCKKLGVHDPLSIILNQQSSATDILEGSTEISVDESLTTFIEETDVSRSLDSSVNTRMSLSLPPPVNSGTEINILEEERKIEAPELPIEQESENKTLDELDNQLSNKRFKRRNANIYITKNDEGIAQ